MIVIQSVDGAQIYKNKQSDAVFGLFKILDLPPELSHMKHAVLPAFLIGGPDPPKHIDSFMYPTLAHLAANPGVRRRAKMRAYLLEIDLKSSEKETQRSS